MPNGPGPDTGYDCSGVCLADADGDGVCDQFEVAPACGDIDACNYYVIPTTTDTDDSLCTYPSTDYLSCDEVCINDSDGDGVCDEVEIEGCTYYWAANYNHDATDDDGSCVPIVTGCIDNTACNFDATANTDDGSCYNNDLGCGCDTPGAEVGYDCSGVCLADADGDGV